MSGADSNRKRKGEKNELQCSCVIDEDKKNMANFSQMTSDI